MLIYRAIFPNGKSYIGRTTQSFNSRVTGHKNKAKRPRYVIHHAIRKYKFENVKWKILEDNITDFEYLKEREKFYIKKFDSFLPNGYNMTYGGDGAIGYKMNEKAKADIRKRTQGKKNPFYGRKHSLDSRIKMWENNPVRKGSLNPFYGKKHSEKTRRKMSLIRQAKNKFRKQHV